MGEGGVLLLGAHIAKSGALEIGHDIRGKAAPGRCDRLALPDQWILAVYDLDRVPVPRDGA